MNVLSPSVQALLKDPSALIPAIVQDFETSEILMLAYMNTESLAITLDTGKATYWSRSRKELWVKGATSGNVQEVQSITLDCDGDALLVRVKQIGVACHTGNLSCFHNSLSLDSQ